MRPRNHSYQRLKIHRNYTVEEMASLLGVHRNSIRRWLKSGLNSIDQKRPILVKGDVLLAFLKAGRAGRKAPCKPGEIYCLRCNAPRKPLDAKVEYQSFTFDRGNLLGICTDCGARLNRRVSLAILGGAMGDLQVTFPQAQEHIDESHCPTLNGYFDVEAQTHV